MKQVKNTFIFLGFFLLLLIFFNKIFSGFVIQGNEYVSDALFGAVRVYSEQMRYIPIQWLDYIWLGMRGVGSQINLFSFFTMFFPVEFVFFFTYFTSIFLSFIFTFLLLRKLNLSKGASVFGAIAYSFAPNFISFIYAGHTLVLEFMMYQPLVFYLLTIIFNKEEKSLLKKILLLFLCGAAWGVLLTNDVQRGLYFSILAAFYIIYKVFEQNKVNKISYIGLKPLLGDALKAFLLLIVLILSFFNGLSSWLEPLRGRMAMQSKASETTKGETGKWNFSTSYSFHPAELIDSLAFGFHGKSSLDSQNLYWGSKEFSSSSESFGFFVLIFGILGMIAFFTRSSLVRFFTFAFAISLLLSFGRYLPGTPFFWLFYKLPLMSNFRAPGKFLAVSAFCIAILSGFGLQYLQNILREADGKSSKALQNLFKISLLLTGIGILFLFIAVIYMPNLSFDMSQRFNNANIGAVIGSNMITALLKMVVFFIISSILLGIANYSTQIKNKVLLIPALFILFLLVDLWDRGWYYVNNSYIKNNEFYYPDGVITQVKREYEDEIFRVATSLFILQGNRVAPIPITSLKTPYTTYYFPYYSIQDFDVSAISSTIPEYDNYFMSILISSALSKPVQTYQDLLELNLRLLRFSNVKYLVMDYNPMLTPIIASNANLVLTNIVSGYKGTQQALIYVKDYLPRVGLYQNYICVAKNEDSLKYLSNSSFDFERYVIVNGGIYSKTNEKAVVKPQKVVLYKAWDIKAEVESDTDGFVLLTSRFDNDWKAYVDGKSATVYKANHAQMGTFVSTGKHIVEFKFEPSFIPLKVSFVTIFVSILASVLYAVVLLIKKLIRQ